MSIFLARPSSVPNTSQHQRKLKGALLRSSATQASASSSCFLGKAPGCLYQNTPIGGVLVSDEETGVKAHPVRRTEPQGSQTSSTGSDNRPTLTNCSTNN